MDPTAAVREFNDADSSPAYRLDLAEGLMGWLARGGFPPTERLDEQIIDRMEKRGYSKLVALARAVNEYIAR